MDFANFFHYLKIFNLGFNLKLVANPCNAQETHLIWFLKEDT
jgi:hypothetical protein